MEYKEWEAVIAGSKRVLASDPRHVQSYGNIGIYYAQLGRKEKTLMALDKALEVDLNYEPARVNHIAIASLEDGEKFFDRQLNSLDIEYYKDYSMKKNSLMSEIL